MELHTQTHRSPSFNKRFQRFPEHLTEMTGESSFVWSQSIKTGRNGCSFKCIKLSQKKGGKITKYMKKQENMAQSKTQNKLSETNHKVTEIYEFKKFKLS